jgi:hypothetical protein
VNPRFPIYIVSKSRAETALTPRFLDSIDVPYTLIVEESQVDQYAAIYGAQRVIAMSDDWRRAYDTCDDLGLTKSTGPGAARNLAWQRSIDEGAPWHWVMDDNISLFARLHQNHITPIGDGTMFHALETFALRWKNLAMFGPQYEMFAKARDKLPPFIMNTRIYSCNLIRNDVPFRWRARYNEDTDLSLRMLKAGWCTVQCYALLQRKVATQSLSGGNTEAFYEHEGTLPKSQMLIRLHPDVTTLVWKFGRWHHHVDYRPFRGLNLIPRDDLSELEDVSYKLRAVKRR